MIVEALITWNHWPAKGDMRTVIPGDLINIRDSVARYMIKEGWARVPA